MVFIGTRPTELTQCWMARSWAGLWGSLMNNYRIIITAVLFLEASGTVPGSPDKFTELRRTQWHFISHHVSPQMRTQMLSAGVLESLSLVGNENILYSLGISQNPNGTLLLLGEGNLGCLKVPLQ